MDGVGQRAGGRTALPVVIEKGQPLVCAYVPGDRLEKVSGIS